MKYNKILTLILTFLLLLVITPSNNAEYDYIIQNENQKTNQLTNSILDLIEAVNETTLRNHVQNITSFGPHPTGSEACKNVRDYVNNELIKFNLDVNLHNWRFKLNSGENVVAESLGQLNPEKIVIICAHYDSIAISPGADDDGSGVAAVLTIAEILSNYEFNHTIRFILFSGEEQGAYGSKMYAKEVYNKGEDIIAVINLDGISYASNSETGKTIRALTEYQSKWITEISKELSKKYANEINLSVEMVSNFIPADHQSFLDYGYDAMMFLETDLSPYYHTSEDTLEHANMTYLTKNTKLVIATFSTIANMNFRLSEEDILISLRGTILSKNSQFKTIVENTKYPDDTANVTVNIAITNFFTGKIVSGQHNSTCNWTFTKEIEDEWVFEVKSRLHRSQIVKATVTVLGIEDDIRIYKNVQTLGFVLSTMIFLRPVTKK